MIDIEESNFKTDEFKLLLGYINTSENNKKKELVGMSNDRFYKNNESDKIWWVDNPETVGEWLFSFDKKRIFNMFRDYPHELTPKQKNI